MSQIVLVGPTYPLKGGGIVTFNELLAKTLLNKGNELKIYTFSLQYPGFLFPGKSQYSKEAPPEGLDIDVCINSVNPLNWLQVGKRIQKQRPDYMIIRYWLPFMAPCLGTIARVAKRNKHTKVIAITDNVIPHERSFADSALTRYFIGACDGFIAMAKSVMEDLDKFDRMKPRQLSMHPIYDNYGEKLSRERALEKLGLDPGYRYLLFFGFIRDYKGLDILLKAMSDKGFDEKKIRLIVAGEYYQNRAPYQKMIKDLDKKVIEIDEFIPADEVNQYFCAADLVVQPYKSATQSGITQIAYHFEIPMIVTNVGGLPEMVPDQKVGYVVEPDPDSIKKAIFRYFEQGREAEFVQNIKTEKLKFSWDVMYNSIQTVYEKTMA